MFIVTHIIQNVLEKEQEEFKKNYRPSGFFSPSSLMYFNCPMQYLLFKLLGSQLKPSFELQTKMDSGNNAHEYIQGKIKKAAEIGVMNPDVVKVEMEVYTPQNSWLIRGKVDVKFTMNDGTIIICEIKTRDEDKFKYMKNPLKSYNEQANLYCFLYGSPRMSILVFNNIDTYKEFQCDFNRSEKLSEVLRHCSTAIQCVKERTLPDRICKTFRESCGKNCDYKGICAGLLDFEELIQKYNIQPRVLFTTWDEYWVIKNKEKAEKEKNSVN